MKKYQGLPGEKKEVKKKYEKIPATDKRKITRKR